MYKSKLIEIFIALAPTEQRALGKFVRSPFHNRREDVIQLYDYIYKHRKLEDRAALQKEKVFDHLFPNQSFVSEQMDYIMSFLLKTIEQFLMVQSLLNDKIESQIRLSDAYRMLRLDKPFKQAWRYATQLQNKQPLRDSNYFRRAYYLEYQQYSLSVLKARTEVKNLEKLVESFDIYYLTQRFKLACLMLAHEAVYKTSYDLELVKNLDQYVKTRRELLDNHPVLSIYYYYFQTLTTEEETKAAQQFLQFNQLFRKYVDALSRDELQDLYTFAINYCIRRYNTGSPQFVYELMALFKTGLETKILLKRNLLPNSTYLNIVKTALKINDFEWVEYFITTYTPKLAVASRDNYHSYALGEFHYSQKNYKKAMLALNQVSSSDLLMTISTRFLLMKIYYELQEQDALDSLINSINIYLSRKVQLGYHRENYKNILKYMRKLTTVNPFDQQSMLKLRKTIEQESLLTEKPWFLLQIDALLQKK